LQKLAEDASPITDGKFSLSLLSKVSNPINYGTATVKAKAFINRLKIKPKLRVFRNVEDMKLKAPEFYKAAAAARADGKILSTASGYSFGDGNVVVFTDNIVDNQHLKVVLAHETLGHFGMRGVMSGKDFSSLMNAVYDASEIVRSRVAAAMSARSGMSKAEAVEEYLADYAAALDTSLIARVWDKLKNALNKVGVKFGDDAARYLVGHARNYVINGSKSAAFDNTSIGIALMDSTTGVNDAKTGRFMDNNTISSMGLLAGARDGATKLLSNEGLRSRMRSIEENMDRIKAEALSLTNFRSLQNPGARKFYEIILGANRWSMSLKNSANERLKGYLDRQVTLLPGKSYGAGVSKTEKATIDRMLYAAQRYAVATADPVSSTRKPDLVFVNDQGEVEVNTARLEELKKKGRRTLKDFQNGFTYTVVEEENMTETRRNELRAEKVREMNAAATPADKNAIEAKYDAEIASPYYLSEPKKVTFPGNPDLKEDSVEWRQYQNIRDVMDDIDVLQVKANYTAHLKTIDGELESISSAMDGGITPADRVFILKMNEKYNTLYNSGRTVSEDGQIVFSPASVSKADDFLIAVNKALIGKDSDRDAVVKEFFDASQQTAVANGITDFKSRFKYANGKRKNDPDRYVVQNKIKEIAINEFSRDDSGFFAERSISTGYIPVLREGRFQVRVQARDPNTGEILKLKDSVQDKLSYHQVESIGEAGVLRDRVNEVFGSGDNIVEFLDKSTGKVSSKTIVETIVLDATTGEYVLKDVVLDAVAEKALDGIGTPPQLNLNEFITGLRRFSINLKPEKMEEVITAMTRQNNRARNRLERAFTPGADPDAGKAISQHLESRASTIAKTLARPDLDQLMDLRLEKSRKLWYANDDKYLAELQERFDTVTANPKASDIDKAQARRALDEYKYQQASTSRTSKDGVSMAMTYYGESARALAFMESQTNLDESDLGSGDIGSRIRSVTSLMQLGGSPATAALNLISLVTNTIPYLATYNDYTSFGGGFSLGATIAAMSKAASQVGTKGALDGTKNRASYYKRMAESASELKKAGLTKDEAEFLAEQIDSGVAQPALTNSLIATARGRVTQAWLQKSMDGWMVGFNRTESAARRTALLAAYRLQYDRSRLSAIAAGDSQTQADAVAKKEASTFAVRTAEDTLGEYSVMNRPAIWRGGPQQFLYMYKIFPTMSVQLLSNMDKRGKLMMLSGIVALSGLSGLPGAEDLEDLADTIAARLGFSIGSWRLEAAKALDEAVPGLSPYLLNGFANAMFAGDVGGRTSLGDLIPGTSIFLPGTNVGRDLKSIAGPVFGAAEGALNTTFGLGQWVLSTAGVIDTKVSLESIAREAPATMVRAWADAYAYTQSGAIVDKRGYKVSEDMSAWDVFARTMGFYPSSAADSYDIIRVAQRVSNTQKHIAASYYNAFVQARLRGDRDAANEVLREVREWNARNKDSGLKISNFAKNAYRRLREARRPARERALKAVPISARQQMASGAELLGY